jgi:glyoxylase-like metal-dependent hydrolase (beta-lactamase superfamily II)
VTHAHDDAIGGIDSLIENGIEVFATYLTVNEADIDKWRESVKKVSEKYDDVEIVIPGHGLFGNDELIKHTIKLLEMDSR